jgi:hypothetical protein
MNIFIQSIVKSVFVTLCLLSASNVYADCSSAESDIATLEQEKRDNDDRIAKGVFSVLPMGLALNAVNSSGKSKEEKMDAKEYKAKINSRIAEIKAECDIK